MECTVTFLLWPFVLSSLVSELTGYTNVNSNLFDRFGDLFKISTLPDYVVANISNLRAVDYSTIRKKAHALNFPLSEKDKIDIRVLETKFDNEKDCAGLAAPQIGISKRIIVFKVEEEKGVTQTFAKTIWINPSYEKASEETELAYEQCFSVAGVTGPVKRYKSISYNATDINGNEVQDKADGWAARVIQHETDHLNGILFIDLVPPQKIITIEHFRAMLKNYEAEEERKSKQHYT